MTRTTPMLILALGACAPDVPDAPSFQQDVLPILAANCVRCHSPPAIGGAPELIRFDLLDDVVVRPRTLPPGDPACAASNPSPDPGCFDVTMLGASTLASAIAQRVADEDRPMPPRFPLDDWQIDLLETWAAQGGGRGDPRPGNQRPTATLDAVTRQGDAAHLEVTVGDPDRDLVGGTLVAQLATGEQVIGLVGSGRTTLVWDTSNVPPGIYPVRARLDDGAGITVIELPTITVGGP